jgi:hypothetical protein
MMVNFPYFPIYSLFPSKKQLVNQKTKALRYGNRLKALQRIDGVFFNLILRIVNNIRSSKLVKSTLTLTRKPGNTGKNLFLNRLNAMGLPIAKRIISIGRKIGNQPVNHEYLILRLCAFWQSCALVPKLYRNLLW